MNILIYGAGALGQAVGCMLAKSGYSVDFILRNRFIEAIEKQGLEVDGVLGEFTAPPENLGLFESVDAAEKQYEYVFITTKTYDTSKAIADIRTLGNRAAVIVSLQNGCGNVEQLHQAFGGSRTLGGRVITGFEISSPGRVHISVTADAIHIGGSVSGNIPAAATQLAEKIEASGHPCIAVQDIHKSLYAKLLYNCALNPLGALLGVHYGALADNDQTKSIMDTIIEETFSVIRAMSGRTQWQSAEGYKEYFYQTLIPATYNHRASMLQDIENGKPTEVDALVGYVSSQGKRNGVTTPSCDLLTAMVKFKEVQKREEKENPKL